MHKLCILARVQLVETQVRGSKPSPLFYLFFIFLSFTIANPKYIGSSSPLSAFVVSFRSTALSARLLLLLRCCLLPLSRARVLSAGSVCFFFKKKLKLLEIEMIDLLCLVSNFCGCNFNVLM